MAYVITYATTTFITPSPIEIPIDIWSRYLLYLPGSILAGVGFLRQWHHQRKLGFYDVSNLMLGAGLAFLSEAVVLGLIVPAAPYGPASYYNYNRTINNAFMGEQSAIYPANALIGWLDYQSVLNTTGISIEIWRLLLALIVTFFVVNARMSLKPAANSDCLLYSGSGIRPNKRPSRVKSRHGTRLKVGRGRWSAPAAALQNWSMWTIPCLISLEIPGNCYARILSGWRSSTRKIRHLK